MTKLFMYLLADDYGFFNELIYFCFITSLLIIIFVFTVLKASTLDKEKEQRVWSISFVIYINVMMFGVVFVGIFSNYLSPKEIPEHGTYAQKQKIVYCVRQYRDALTLKDITRYNIVRIMSNCQEKDRLNKQHQENDLKNKQFQESLDSLDSI